MSDGDTHLRADQGARHRGVDVADDSHPVGSRLLADRLEADQDFRRLHGVRGRTDAQVEIGRGDPEVAEEYLGHLLVIVLAGMDKKGLDSGVPGFRAGIAFRYPAEKRGDFHEIRAGAGDEDEFEGHGELEVSSEQ